MDKDKMDLALSIARSYYQYHVDSNLKVYHP